MSGESLSVAMVPSGGEIQIHFSEPPQIISPNVSKPTRDFESEWHSDVTKALISRINLLPHAEPQPEDRPMIRKELLQIIAERGYRLSGVERQEFADVMLNEIYGWGPIQRLFDDSTITDILVNRHDLVFVERDGQLIETDVRFHSPEQYRTIINRMAAQVNRRIDESSPTVDARLPDGSRMNAVISPIAIKGPYLSIRKHRKDPFHAGDLLAFRSLSPGMLEFLRAAIVARLNIIISGSTGSGKTTLLNVLGALIPPKQAVITVEDTAELNLPLPNVRPLEARPANIEGKGAVTQAQLVTNALRMRPDRIIVGEVRGAEVRQMLVAMNTGHPGSLVSIHADDPRAALSRLESLYRENSEALTESSARKTLAMSINLIIQTDRQSDGVRRITSITEVTGMNSNEVIGTNELFSFERSGIDASGAVHGKFKCSQVRPQCMRQIAYAGILLSPDVFTDMEV